MFEQANTTGLAPWIVVAALATPTAWADFNLSGPTGSNVDQAPPGTVFQMNVNGSGTISDLNFAIHLYNNRSGVTFPGTMAWGDIDAVLSKDGVSVQLWQAGNPGETSDLFVVLDNNSTEGITLNDVLAPAGPNPAPTLAPQAYTSGVASPVDPNNIAASYLPVGNLSAFNGLPLDGTWTLTLSDPVVPNEGDTLLNWQIFGSGATGAVIPPAPTLHIKDEFVFRETRYNPPSFFYQGDNFLASAFVEDGDGNAAVGSTVTVSNNGTVHAMDGCTFSCDVVAFVPYSNAAAQDDWVFDAERNGITDSVTVAAIGTGPGTGPMPGVDQLQITPDDRTPTFTWSSNQSIKDGTANDGNIGRYRIRVQNLNGGLIFDQRLNGVPLTLESYTVDVANELPAGPGCYVGQVLLEGFSPFIRSRTFKQFSIDNGCDTDGDGIANAEDNCPTVHNPAQKRSGENANRFHGDRCVHKWVEIPASASLGYAPIIAKDVQLETNTSIGNHVDLGKGTQIKDGAEIGDNLTTGKEVIIEAASIGNDVSIGRKAKVEERVTIGDRVMIGRDSVIKVDAVIGDDVSMARNVTVGTATIGAGSSIGRNVIINDGVTLPAGSVVPKNTELNP